MPGQETPDHYDLAMVDTNREPAWGLCSAESPAGLIGEKTSLRRRRGPSWLVSDFRLRLNLLNFRAVSLASLCLDCLKQLVHIFSSNGLTRTVTSTVYGGTRARRIPSIFTIVEILGKRSSGFGVEYQFKLEPLWLLADLIEKSRMRRVHIRRYETRLV